MHVARSTYALQFKKAALMHLLTDVDGQLCQADGRMMSLRRMDSRSFYFRQTISESGSTLSFRLNEIIPSISPTRDTNSLT